MSRMRGLGAAIVGAAVAVSASHAQPQTASRLVASGFADPVFATAPPGDPGRLFVVERTGRVKIVKTATWLVNSTPFLDVSALARTSGGDDGLLGLAFDPAYSTSGRVYAYYIALDGYGTIARYTVSANPDVADAASASLIWRYARPQGHYGGWLAFSPIDGFLYLSSGDGGNYMSFDSPNRAQTITNQLMGKILRIDPTADAFPADANRNYRIPATNPFVGVTGDDEIWAYGLRNPWRCSFDRSNGDLWIADVGQDLWEEIDYQASGAGGRNYGWRCMEANACTGLTGCTCNAASLTLPLHTYDHTLGSSVTGGYVYRGSAIPALQGAYLYGDFISYRMWTFVRSGSAVTQLTERTAELHPPAPQVIEAIPAFGEDAAGELYIFDFFGGNLFKVVPPSCPVAITQQPPAVLEAVAGQALSLSVLATGADVIQYQWRRNGADLVNGGRISGATGAALTINPAAVSDSGSYTVRVWNQCGPVVSAAAAVPVFCPADVDHNGQITPADVAMFVGAWFASLEGGTLAGDFDHSGAVTPTDVASFVGAWYSTLNNGC